MKKSMDDIQREIRSIEEEIENLRKLIEEKKDPGGSRLEASPKEG